MGHKLSKEDTLIIDGREITENNGENFECEFEFGETTVDYTINLKVVKGSECYKKLKEAQENKDKYKIQVNIIEKENKQ